MYRSEEEPSPVGDGELARLAEYGQRTLPVLPAQSTAVGHADTAGVVVQDKALELQISRIQELRLKAPPTAAASPAGGQRLFDSGSGSGYLSGGTGGPAIASSSSTGLPRLGVAAGEEHVRRAMSSATRNPGVGETDPAVLSASEDRPATAAQGAAGGDFMEGALPPATWTNVTLVRTAYHNWTGDMQQRVCEIY